MEREERSESYFWQNKEKNQANKFWISEDSNGRQGEERDMLYLHKRVELKWQEEQNERTTKQDRTNSKLQVVKDEIKAEDKRNETKG